MAEEILYDVTAVGELLIDFAPAGADADGTPLFRAQEGGAPVNYLAALAACGCRTAMIGKVGRDAFGRMLTDTLRTRGVETRGVRADADAFTTLAFVTLDADGERSFHFARKPGADTLLRTDELVWELIDGARTLHFGTLSLTDEPAAGATAAAVERARARGRQITFDPNLRLPLWKRADDARAAMDWGLRQADIVKLALDEAAFLLGPVTPEDAARQLMDTYGVRLVMITMGAAGCCLCNGTAAVRAPAMPVKPVDTTGAGDIFFGAAMSRVLAADAPPALLDADALSAVARFACCAAGLSVCRRGGVASVPAEAEIRSALMNP